MLARIQPEPRNFAESESAEAILGSAARGARLSEAQESTYMTAAMQAADEWAKRLATWFGCGMSPVAPGTVGALGAVPVHLLLRLLPPGVHIASVLAITAAGFWSADRYAKALGEEDPQSAVIDEVAGVLIAMGFVRSRSFAAQLAAFLLFRLFDITKPGLIDKVQHTEPPGAGIMLDDVLAGLLGGVVARFISRA